jgi:hypothetical protein
MILPGARLPWRLGRGHSADAQDTAGDMLVRQPVAACVERVYNPVSCVGLRIGIMAGRLCIDQALRFSRAWQQMRPQREQRQRMHFFQETAPRRTPYLPHGSVKPQRLHRTTQPGARRSYRSVGSVLPGRVIGLLHKRT